MKMLIALITSETAQKRNVARVIAKVLNVMHLSIEAPIYNVMEQVTGVETNELMFSTEPFKKLPLVDCTGEELKNRLRFAITTSNQNYLLEQLHGHLFTERAVAKTALDSIFNGHLITDITLPSQAQYIRCNKGIVVHLLQSGSKLPHMVKPMPEDIVITLPNSEPATEAFIKGYCESIRKRFEAPQAKAA